MNTKRDLLLLLLLGIHVTVVVAVIVVVAFVAIAAVVVVVAVVAAGAAVVAYSIDSAGIVVYLTLWSRINCIQITVSLARAIWASAQSPPRTLRSIDVVVFPHDRRSTTL